MNKLIKANVSNHEQLFAKEHIIIQLEKEIDLLRNLNKNNQS